MSDKLAKVKARVLECPRCGGRGAVKSVYVWRLSVVLAVAGCGGRTSLFDAFTELPAAGGSAGEQTGGSSGVTASGGSVSGAAGSVATAGSAGGPVTCMLAPADCASAADPACKGQRPNCTGDFSYHLQLDSPSGVFVTDIATSRDGRIGVTGYFRGTFEVGGQIITSPPAPNSPIPTRSFVLSFDSKGTAQWAYVYPELEYLATSVRFAPNGDAVMQAGTYYDNAPGAAVVRLSTVGKPVWTKAWGDAGHLTPGRLDVGSNGHIWLSGSLRVSLDFPGLVLATGEDTSGYLLELDESGNGLRAFLATPPGWSASLVSGIAIDGDNNLLVIGTGESRMLTAFFEKFSSTGELLLTKSFQGQVKLSSVAVDSEMRPTVFGQFTGSFANEGKKLNSAGAATNVWLAQYTRDGKMLWQSSYGGNAVCDGGTADPFGNLLLAGSGNPVIDGKPLADSSGTSFVVKLRADGKHVWSRPLNGHVSWFGVATDQSANIWLSGQYDQPIRIDNALLSPASTAGLLLELAP